MMKSLVSYYFAKFQSSLCSRPYALRLDTNNVCNLKCIYCGINDPNQVAEFMSLEHFKQAAKWFFPKSSYVSLSFATEPLMSKDFHLFIEELGMYAVPDTHFITNGLLLTEEIVKASIIAKLGSITISNDAATPESYKRIRGGSFTKLMAKLKLIQELKTAYRSATPVVRIQFTLFEYNKEEVAPFIEKYHPYFQEFYLSHISPNPDDQSSNGLLGRISTEEFIAIRTKTIAMAEQYGLKVKIIFNNYQREKLTGKHCTLPLSARFLYSNGGLMMCDKQVYGNIFSEDLPVVEKRIRAAFGKYNCNCEMKCTQPIAKNKDLDYRPC